MVHKLSFISKLAWSRQKKWLQDEDKNYLKGVSVIEVGNIPIPATYDEEGNELTEASAHTDWAVDVDIETLPDELQNYLIPTKSKYAHNIAGRTDINTQ